MERSLAVTFKDDSERTIDNPADFPDPGGLLKVVRVQEPMIRATIVAPDEYTGAIINLCTVRPALSFSLLFPGRVEADAGTCPCSPTAASRSRTRTSRARRRPLQRRARRRRSSPASRCSTRCR